MEAGWTLALMMEVTMLHSSVARPSESTAYLTAARMAATYRQIFSLSTFSAAFACNAATLNPS